jgi:hypothetical protein
MVIIRCLKLCLRKLPWLLLFIQVPSMRMRIPSDGLFFLLCYAVSFLRMIFRELVALMLCLSPPRGFTGTNTALAVMNGFRVSKLLIKSTVLHTGGT